MARPISWTIPNGVTLTAQKVQKRLKGTTTWDDTGFVPTNLMGPLVTSATVTLLPNRKYEFQKLDYCGGSTLMNTAGIVEGMEFSCITPNTTVGTTSSTLSLSASGTDILGARVTLRRLSDNTISFGPTVIPVSSGSIIATANGLAPSTQFYWQVELYATINGQTVYSSAQNQLTSPCGSYSVQTGTSFGCIAPTSFDIFEPEGGIGVIVQGTNVSAIKFYLKKTSDGSIVYSGRVNKTQTYDGATQSYIDVCVLQVPASVQSTYIDGEQYQWYYEMFSTINGVETGSQPSIGYCNQTPWQYPAVVCIEPSITSVDKGSTLKIDVGNGPYYKAKVSLKDNNGNLVTGFPQVVEKQTSGQDLNKIVVQSGVLGSSSNYTWEYQLVSSFNNQDVVHTAVCGPYSTATSQGFSIYPQPVNQMVNVGQNASFSSAAIGGNGPITYQWQTTMASNPQEGDWTNYPNAVGTTFNVNNVQLNQNNLGVRQTATQNGVTIKSTLARLYVTNPSPEPVGGFLYSATDPYTDNNTVPSGTFSNDIAISSNSTTQIDYPLPPSAQNNFIGFRVPSGVTDFNNWTCATQTGQIPDSVIRQMFTVGGYDYYVSRGVFAFNTNDTFKLLQ